jgi:hypothetical protein
MAHMVLTARTSSVFLTSITVASCYSPTKLSMELMTPTYLLSTTQSNKDWIGYDLMLTIVVCKYLSPHAFSNPESSFSFGKPVAMSGFGLVTQQNSQAFTPFNSSVAPFASDCPSPSGCPSSGGTKRDLQPQIPFVTPDQQLDAYRQWINGRLRFIVTIP